MQKLKHTILLLVLTTVLSSCQITQSNNSVIPGTKESLCDNKTLTLLWSFITTKDGDKMFATDIMANRMLIISPLLGRVISSISTLGTTNGLAISSDSLYVYVVNTNPAMLLVISTETDKIIKTYNLNMKYAHDVGLAPDNSTAYVSSNSEKRIAVIDLSGKKPIHYIPLANNLYKNADLSENKLQYSKEELQLLIGKDVSHDGRLYAALNGNSAHNKGEIKIFKTKDSTLLASIPIVGNPEWAAFSPDGNYIFVKSLINIAHTEGNTTIHSSNNSLIIIDTNKQKVIKTIKPDNIIGNGTFSPDGKMFYIFQIQVLSGKLYMPSVGIINVETKKFIGKINTPKTGSAYSSCNE